MTIFSASEWSALLIWSSSGASSREDDILDRTASSPTPEPRLVVEESCVMDVAMLPLSPSLTREVATVVAKALMSESGLAVPKSD